MRKPPSSLLLAACLAGVVGFGTSARASAVLFDEFTVSGGYAHRHYTSALPTAFRVYMDSPGEVGAAFDYEAEEWTTGPGGWTDGGDFLNGTASADKESYAKDLVATLIGPRSGTYNVTDFHGKILGGWQYNISYSVFRIFFSVIATDPEAHVRIYALDYPSHTPEPATWALMIGGFGAVGMVLRTRRDGALRRRSEH